MNIISLTLPLPYLLLVLGLCTYLLIRGITHLFVGLFAVGALLQMIPRLGFIALSEAPGGFAANSSHFHMFSIFGGSASFASQQDLSRSRCFSCELLKRSPSVFGAAEASSLDPRRSAAAFTLLREMPAWVRGVRRRSSLIILHWGKVAGTAAKKEHSHG